VFEESDTDLANWEDEIREELVEAVASELIKEILCNEDSDGDDEEDDIDLVYGG
jgi:hypothetical protein